MFTLVGAQIVTIGFFAKVFSYAERFSHISVHWSVGSGAVKLEHGLALGAALALSGWPWFNLAFLAVGRLSGLRSL